MASLHISNTTTSLSNKRSLQDISGNGSVNCGIKSDGSVNCGIKSDGSVKMQKTEIPKPINGKYEFKSTCRASGTQNPFAHVRSFFILISKQENVPADIKSTIDRKDEAFSAMLFVNGLIDNIKKIEPTGAAWAARTYVKIVRYFLKIIFGRHGRKFTISSNIDEFCQKIRTCFQDGKFGGDNN